MRRIRPGEQQSPGHPGTLSPGPADCLRQALFGLFVLSLGAYAYGAFTSTLFDRGLADKRAFLVTASRAYEGNPAEENRGVQRHACALFAKSPEKTKSSREYLLSTIN